jgi:hypothetical protein
MENMLLKVIFLKLMALRKQQCDEENPQCVTLKL